MLQNAEDISSFSSPADVARLQIEHARTTLWWIAAGVDLCCRAPFFYETPLAKYGRSWATVAKLCSTDFPESPFVIPDVEIGREKVGVLQSVVIDEDFYRVLYFKREKGKPSPTVLLVTPMAGHYASLLEGTVQGLLRRGLDVHVVAWKNPRDIPLDKGIFSVSTYINSLISILQKLGPGTHLVAVCQPGPEALVATAAMVEDGNSCVPRSLTFIASPLDTRKNPTAININAKKVSPEWVSRNLISTLDWRFKGEGRKVLPDVLQLLNFVAPNVEKHLKSISKLFDDLVVDNLPDAQKTGRFYQKYFEVMHVHAQFLVETFQKIFRDHDLPLGKFSFVDAKGKERVPDISKVEIPIATFEGEKDDVCGLGQTEAAHDMCPHVSKNLRRKVVVPKAGHYSAFTGKLFEQYVTPVFEAFVTFIEDQALRRAPIPRAAQQAAAALSAAEPVPA